MQKSTSDVTYVVMLERPLQLTFEQPQVQQNDWVPNPTQYNRYLEKDISLSCSAQKRDVRNKEKCAQKVIHVSDMQGTASARTPSDTVKVD